jgi:hypothetical protein
LQIDSRAVLRHRFLPHTVAVRLREHELTLVIFSTTEGTHLAIKASKQRIEELAQPQIVALHSKLHRHPAAPVIEIGVRLAGRGRPSLDVRTYLNVAEPNHRAELIRLAEHPEFDILLYDEVLKLRGAITTKSFLQSAILQTLVRAESYLSSVPHQEFDFAAAQTAVSKGTSVSLPKSNRSDNSNRSRGQS